MIQFEHPVFLLLVLPLVALAWWPRRRPLPYLAVSLPPALRRRAPQAAAQRRLTRLPVYCLYGFLVILVIVMSEPYLGTVERHEVEEARSILLLLDTSASMIQTGLLKRVVTGFLVPFIAERPPADRLAVARFDSDASGGIFTRNHDGVVMEITRRSVVQQFDVARDLAMLSTKGTQLGVGLFKALASFVEDEVERRVAQAGLDVAEQDAVYRNLQDVLGRFLGYFQSKSKDEFRLQLPLVETLADVGPGKSMIVITDGQLLDSSSEATRVDYLKILEYYEQLGFAHLYFVSLKSHPAQLNPLLGRNPNWRAYTWDQTRAGLSRNFCPHCAGHRHLGARQKHRRHRGHPAGGGALVSSRPAAPAAERRSAAAPAPAALPVGAGRRNVKHDGVPAIGSAGGTASMVL